MDKFSITGRSASLFSLLRALIPANGAGLNPGQADDRLRVDPGAIVPFLANQKLAEFFAAQEELSLEAVTSALFPPCGTPQEFAFEPDERMMSDQEKEVCIAAVSKAIRTGTCIYGNEIETLEACLAEFLGVKHVLLCSSGTEALMVALFALGLEPGDAG
jgi:DegT/DnrJ/EryC1/StrS aminotransferase family